MSVSIINDQTIAHVANIDWTKVSAIKEVPNLFKKYRLTSTYISEEKFRDLKNDKVVDLSKRLHNLQADLDKYNPSLIQRIINFFTGRLFTLCRLRNVLPEVIKAIKGVASKIIAEKAKVDAANKKQAEDAAKVAEEARKKQAEDARKLKRDAELAKIAQQLAQQKADELAKKRADAAKAAADAQAAAQANAAAQAAAKAAAANGSGNAAQLAQQAAQAQAALLAAQAAAKAALAAAVPDDVQDEAAIEKGEIIRVNESNLPISPSEMNYKRALMARVISQIDKNLGQYDLTILREEIKDLPAAEQQQILEEATPSYPIEVAQKIQKYANTVFAKLLKGKNVPLPFWNHATGRYGDPYGDAEKIVKSGHLHQLGAPRGYGTYFSSLDESHNDMSYGLHTMVFDEGAFQDIILNPTQALVNGQQKMTEVHYFPGDRQGKQNSAERSSASLWLRVRCVTPDEYNEGVASYNRSPRLAIRLNCVPVNTNTVAYVCTEKTHVKSLQDKFDQFNKDMETAKQDLQAKKQRNPYYALSDADRAVEKFTPFKISVLDRRTEADYIRYIFDLVQTQNPQPRRSLLPKDHVNDKEELVGKVKQSILVKYRDGQQLIYQGGRHIPTTWKPHEGQENFHFGFPKHMQQLAWENNNGRKLTATFAES